MKERLPFFDGGTLDNIIDYLCYVFIPVLLIIRANLLPEGVDAFFIGSAIMMASAYGFSRTDAKVEAGGEHFFTGFPSYWNIVALYLYVWRLEQHVTAAILLIFAVLVFVPLRYVYPSRTTTLAAADDASWGSRGRRWRAGWSGASRRPTAPGSGCR